MALAGSSVHVIILEHPETCSFSQLLHWVFWAVPVNLSKWGCSGVVEAPWLRTQCYSGLCKGCSYGAVSLCHFLGCNNSKPGRCAVVWHLCTVWFLLSAWKGGAAGGDRLLLALTLPALCPVAQGRAHGSCWLPWLQHRERPNAGLGCCWCALRPQWM